MKKELINPEVHYLPYKYAPVTDLLSERIRKGVQNGGIRWPLVFSYAFLLGGATVALTLFALT